MGAWVGAALTGLGALGSLFGPKKSTSTTNYNSTSTPNLLPQDQLLMDNLTKKYGDLINGAGSGEFERAYTTGGLKNINTASQRSQQAIMDMLTARGLGRTTAGGVTAGEASMNGANQTANFLNSVPLIMDQRLQAILQQAGGYEASIPKGSTVSGSQTFTGVGNAPTSPIAGLISGGAQGAATVLGQYNATQNFLNSLKNLFPTGPSTIYLPSGTSGWDQGG